MNAPALEIDTNNGRILLVDDDHDLVMALKDALEPRGFSVATAEESSEVPRLTEDFQPDIAVLDIRLGSANGLDLIPFLKARVPDIGCVVMTGFAETETAVTAIRNGADDYLYKPVDPEDLIRTLQRLLQQQRLEREREAAVSALRESEERQRIILENVADAVVTIDETGIIQSANPAALDLFGYEMAELIGENVSLFLTDGERGRHDGYIQNYLLSGQGKILGVGPREVTGSRKDGTPLDLELAVSETPVRGGRVFIGALRDISERKRLEERLRHAAKMEAVGRLTGGLAHDFNNMLGVIMGNVELLEDIVGDDNPRVQAVVRASTRGAELINRLHTVSRLQSLDPRPVDLRAVVAGVLEMWGRALGEGIETRVETGPALWRAEADPEELENALLNMIVNSGHAMSGGGLLTVGCENLDLAGDRAAEAGAEPGHYVGLIVEDTGAGIPPEVLDRVFEPYFTTKGVGEGSGLGLSMVYGFARQSGGFVEIESEVGRGTVVKLYLPRAVDEEAETEIRVERLIPEGNGEIVLVVEDDETVRSLVVSLLKKLNYKVIQAPDAKIALAILDQPIPIDLLLSDILLPGGMSGWQLAEEAASLRPTLKAAFMSGFPGELPAKEDWPRGGEDILKKPFRKGELARRIHAAIAGDG